MSYIVLHWVSYPSLLWSMLRATCFATSARPGVRLDSEVAIVAFKYRGERIISLRAFSLILLNFVQFTHCFIVFIFICCIIICCISVWVVLHLDVCVICPWNYVSIVNYFYIFLCILISMGERLAWVLESRSRSSHLNIYFNKFNKVVKIK